RRLKAHAGRETLAAWILEPVRSQVMLFIAGRPRERMVVGVRIAAIHPLHEMRSWLEGRIALTEKINLGDADLFQGGSNRRPRAFADADRRLPARLDEGDRKSVFAPLRKTRREHPGGDPAGGAAPDDDDFSDRRQF